MGKKLGKNRSGVRYPGVNASRLYAIKKCSSWYMSRKKLASGVAIEDTEFVGGAIPRQERILYQNHNTFDLLQLAT